MMQRYECMKSIVPLIGDSLVGTTVMDAKENKYRFVRITLVHHRRVAPSPPGSGRESFGHPRLATNISGGASAVARRADSRYSNRNAVVRTRTRLRCHRQFGRAPPGDGCSPTGRHGL